jgi:hypothetical protein
MSSLHNQIVVFYDQFLLLFAFKVRKSPSLMDRTFVDSGSSETEEMISSCIVHARRSQSIRFTFAMLPNQSAASSPVTAAMFAAVQHDVSAVFAAQSHFELTQPK